MEIEVQKIPALAHYAIFEHNFNLKKSATQPTVQFQSVSIWLDGFETKPEKLTAKYCGN